MKEKKKATPKGAKVTKEFMFKLTEKESNEKGRAAAALKKEVDKLELQFEEAKDSWKAKINTREDKYKELLDVVDAQEEKRTVEAILVHNYETKQIEFWFDGEVKEKRDMTDAELQREMNFDQTNKKAKGIRQKLQKAKDATDPVAAAHNDKVTDINEVRRAETSRHTKSSAVDGPKL